MTPLSEFLPKLVALRRELHQNPELSGREVRTARILYFFCKAFNPTRIIEKVGGTGIALVFEGEKPGNTLLFRADMDALPIEEEIEVPYTSPRKSLSHKCGHDGHMAILAGLAFMFSQHPVRHGRVILLFQPAEETGKGALAVLHDPKFRKIRPDLVFALHNLPGFPRHSIVIRNGTMAMASEGLHIRLRGHAAHAAYPGQGISPVPAMLELVAKIPKIPKNPKLFKGFVQVSLTHLGAGKFGFGTVPGTADLALTLRASDPAEFAVLHEQVVKLVAKTAARHYLEESVKRWEPFEATLNSETAADAVRRVAVRHNYPVVELEEPFRWSEDFGQFTAHYRGALFGLGAGENQSDLHTWYYDFPDEILETGIRMFFGLTQDLLHD